MGKGSFFIEEMCANGEVLVKVENDRCRRETRRPVERVASSRPEGVPARVRSREPEARRGCPSGCPCGGGHGVREEHAISFGIASVFPAG